MSYSHPYTATGFAARIGLLLDAAIPFRRVQLLVTFGLTLLGAFAELVTLGAVLPVLAIAAHPAVMPSFPVIGPLLVRLSAAIGAGPAATAAVLLVVAAIGSILVRIALLWSQQKFTLGLYQDLTMRIFARSLRQPYSWYLKQNSSDLLASSQKLSTVIFGVINPLLLAFSSGLMAIAMTAFLIYLDPRAAMIAGAVIAVTYALISGATRRRSAKISEVLAGVYSRRMQTMQETLGGIRDINLDQSQPVFEARLLAVEDRYRRVMVVANMLTSAPRVLVEGIAIILIAVMAAWYSSQPGGVIGALPVLGALALGAQRMLPMIQIVYQSWTSYSLYSGTVGDVVDLLRAPVEDMAPLPSEAEIRYFSNSIGLQDLAFSYEPGRAALGGVDLTIAKGERIGVIGKTGSGKSTLVDIVMGLLRPSGGALTVDGEPIGEANLANWKAQIAHVPQAIFLADATIADNIAFGHLPAGVDQGRVERAARDAGLDEFLASLADGLATMVGERGVRLSGGQRQRIGIARALYKKASLLILDEATSALDDETEAAVMASVERLGRDLTIILIAHRLSTLAGCDRIYRLDGGRIVDQGSYDEVTARLRQHASAKRGTR